MLEEAKKYTCRNKFKEESSYCHKLASKIGMFGIFTEHMTRVINKKGYWNRDLIIEISLKHKHRVDFERKDKAAYRAAYRLNIIEDVCSHMVKPEQHRFWTEGKIIECAKKYNKRSDFIKNASGAYNAATKLNILEHVCSHMQVINERIPREAEGRVCRVCKEFKIREEMSVSSNSYSGMRAQCKNCTNKKSSIRIKKNPAKQNYHTANRRAMHKKATPVWITKDNKKAMLSLYKEAKIKTIESGVVYEVDHIIPIRSNEVCGLHVPWNLQVITRTENRIKNNKIIDYV